MDHLIISFLLLSAAATIVASSSVQVCNSHDCTSCQSHNSSFDLPLQNVLGLETAYVSCGLDATSIYGNSSSGEIEFYYGQPDACQQFFGGSFKVSCTDTQTVANNSLGVCEAGNGTSTLYLCEPGKLVQYAFDSSAQCVGTYSLTKTSSGNCPALLYGMCAHLSENQNSLIIALVVFSLFVGICLSVFSSVPWYIFRNDGTLIYPSPQRNEIISRSSPKREVQAISILNGAGSPSTMSELATATWRGSLYLIASCLVTCVGLLILQFISNTIRQQLFTATSHFTEFLSESKWLRILSFLCLSVVAFVPSVPPQKIREKTPVLWCSLGDKICGGKIDTAIIQNFAHICSFFCAIILFIFSEYYEYGGRELISTCEHWLSCQVYYNSSVGFPMVMIFLLFLVIVVQAPIYISRLDCLSCLRFGFMTDVPDDNQKKWLNRFAAAAFCLEVILATCFVCFGLYDELFPISVCLNNTTIKFFPWIIIVSCCVIGNVAGCITSFYECPWDDETSDNAPTSQA